MLALLLLFACETTTTTTEPVCTLGVPTLSAGSAAPGETIVVTVSPLSEQWDTSITVGSARADVVAFDRSTCDDCDQCRDTGGCTVCGTCDACTTPCDTCVETVSFVVPALTAGDYPVEIVNRNGRSAQVTLTVTDPPTP
jgi:hypothetical protein